MNATSISLANGNMLYRRWAWHGHKAITQSLLWCHIGANTPRRWRAFC